jgi:hypothetical protein
MTQALYAHINNKKKEVDALSEQEEDFKHKSTII